MFTRVALLLVVVLPCAFALVEPDGTGRLPALGFNSWNAWGCDIDEEKFLTAANKLVELGLKDAGYVYVNIDDCWSDRGGRDPETKRLLPDTSRFPEGIVGTADKVHDLGLKLGIYSSAGTETCAGYPASIGLEAIDAQTWAEWKVDYLKYDNCNIPQNWTDTCDSCHTDFIDDQYVLANGTCAPDTPDLCPVDYDYSQSNTAKRFQAMRDALHAQDRTILYSLCEWGTAGVEAWGNDTASSWRMSNDINPSWERILDILNQNSFNMNDVDFWGHPDADMLEVGNGLSPQQARTHFALWAAMKSPLLIGTDLDAISADDLAILLNRRLLAFNQDPVVGAAARPYKWGTNLDWTFNASYPAEFWAGASSEGTLVLMFNPYEDTKTKEAVFAEIPGLDGAAAYRVTNVWTGDDIGCQLELVSMDVEGLDTAALLIQESC